jgi:N-methylhydantoinase A
MRYALVPIHAGVLSALGMLVAPRGRQMSHTLCLPVARLPDADIESCLRVLVEQGKEELLAEGIDAGAICADFSLDLRYQGQSFTLNIPYTSLMVALDDFHEAHLQRFGHRLEAPVELVNVRVSLHVAVPILPLDSISPGMGQDSIEKVVLAGVAEPMPVIQRNALEVGHAYRGPMLVIDAVATTFVAAGWIARLHNNGCLMLERSA